MKRSCCPLKHKPSPLPSPTRYPSMAVGILAVPSVSDQTALLDHHCSCKHKETMKWNHSSYKRSSCNTNQHATGVTPSLSSPSKWWETTQQDVGDDSRCPDVHLKAITVQGQTNRAISTPWDERSIKKFCSGSPPPPSLLMFSPCFCNDFRCYICGGPTDGVKRSVHYGREPKVSQFQAFAAICMLVDLQQRAVQR